MDTMKRTVAKAISWQTSGFIVMCLITYCVTGSLTDGGAIALAGMAAGMVMYFLHERLWGLVSWGRLSLQETVVRVD